MGDSFSNSNIENKSDDVIFDKFVESKNLTLLFIVIKLPPISYLFSIPPPKLICPTGFCNFISDLNDKFNTTSSDVWTPFN